MYDTPSIDGLRNSLEVCKQVDKTRTGDGDSHYSRLHLCSLAYEQRSFPLLIAWPLDVLEPAHTV